MSSWRGGTDSLSHDVQISHDPTEHRSPNSIQEHQHKAMEEEERQQQQSAQANESSQQQIEERDQEDGLARQALPMPLEHGIALQAAPSTSVSTLPSEAQHGYIRPPPPVRKRKKLPGGLDKPKSILKPAPPPQKAFSFRRDILQTLNTRLAQQGVNVQVPLPQPGAAQGAANLLGGVFKRLGGIAGAALAAPMSEPTGSSGNQPTVTSATNTPGTQAASPATASLQNLAARQQQTPAAAPASPSTNKSVTAKESSPSTDTSSSTAASGLPAPSSSVKPLKRVQFTVSKMSVVYPISGAIPPCDEDDTRKRIESLHRQTMKERRARPWTPQELEALYRQCCRVREEFPLKKMRLVFEEAASRDPPLLKVLDLSFLPLDRQAIDPLADFLSVDFGLEKLVLENCGLNDDGVKAILHGLLISGTLPNLSLAGNRKIKYQGWRYVAIFMRRARQLRYLDLSENPINRASLEHIAEAIRRSEEDVTRRPREGKEAVEMSDAAITTPHQGDSLDEEDDSLMPPAVLLQHMVDERKGPLISAIISLRLENCGLKGALLSLLGQAVRTSHVKHLSLRRNRINHLGAVALAIMLKDYPESASIAKDDTHIGGQNGESEGERQSRLSNMASSSALRGYSPLPSDGPTIISSPGGGMTVRTAPVPDSSALSDATDVDQHLTQTEEDRIRVTKDPSLTEAEAIALYQTKRAKRILSSLPRVGNLLTLDLKSNDIRGGVAYLAQVLRKNRTLRVLNLSDNGIEIDGLVAIAEALKYNSTLETLDLSHNPCSGPGLEGITTLRTAFALNSNLKRLFLNDTDLSSEGAIALAEFLPEARSLIHLDLTENFDIDIAGVMALAVSVKLNKSLRCLDLNIPPNDPDFARLSQEILQSCIRNTEAAQRKATQKGLKQPIAAPIYKSVVARAAKEKDERQKAISATTAAGQASTAEYRQLIEAAQECRIVLQDLLNGERRRRSEVSPDRASSQQPPSKGFVDDLVAQAQKLRGKLGKAVRGMEEGELLAKALQINDDLEDVSDRLVNLYREEVASRLRTPSTSDSDSHRESVPSPPHSGGTASASFSIADEDDDDDDDEDEGESGGVAALASVDGIALGSGPEGHSNLVAEKEEMFHEQCATPDSPGEMKAKSMVDEEGEIFRRAKSLQLGEEEDDAEEGGKEAQPPSMPEADSSAGSPLGSSIGSSSHPPSQVLSEDVNTPTSPRPGTSRRISNASSSSISSLSESSSATSASAAATLALVRDEGEQVEDLPGEELKRRLLEADVPVPTRGTSPRPAVVGS